VQRPRCSRGEGRTGHFNSQHPRVVEGEGKAIVCRYGDFTDRECVESDQRSRRAECVAIFVSLGARLDRKTGVDVQAGFGAASSPEGQETAMPAGRPLRERVATE
jgi:hypothetical protein